MKDDPTFHKRVNGECTCEVPLTTSVLPSRFWCGKCGKNLKPLKEVEIQHIEGIDREEDLNSDFYRTYGRYLIGD